MYIHSVKINYYKSFGDNSNSEMIIEPGITAIIGKNETGKSNIINALKGINFISNSNHISLFNDNNRNRNCRQDISFEFILKPTQFEKHLLSGNTIIIVKKNQQKTTGALYNLFKENLYDQLISITEAIKSTKMSSLTNQEKSYFHDLLNSIKNDLFLDIPKTNEFLKWLIKFKTPENTDQYELLEQFWLQITSTLPTIFFFEDNNQLKAKYTFAEINEELKKTNSILSQLIRIINIDKVKFLEAASTNNTSQRNSSIQEIEDQVHIFFDRNLKKYYKTEHTQINIHFEPNTISFTVKTNDGTWLSLNERSEGFKWYLNLFIQAKSHDIPTINSLYLFDEPGIHLHVNAQDEVLNIFDDLSKSGNQVLYTTHSPYMINLESNGIHRVRAVKKDKDGYSTIYNNVHDIDCEDNTTSKSETLTPIIDAIGMRYGSPIGPLDNKLNVICEGMSDYIYIFEMAKFLNIDMSKFNIISSVGASNSINLYSILTSWGCKAICLFDYDNQGIQEARNLNKNYQSLFDNSYIFINGKTLPETNKIPTEEKFEIEDMIGRDCYEKYKSNSPLNIGKVLIAKRIMDDVINQKIELPKESLDNFKKLFSRITKIAE